MGGNCRGQLGGGGAPVEELINGTDRPTFDKLALDGRVAKAFCPVREGSCRAEGDWCNVWGRATLVHVKGMNLQNEALALSPNKM